VLVDFWADRVVPAGHQIGVPVTSGYSECAERADSPGKSESDDNPVGGRQVSRVALPTLKAVHRGERVWSVSAPGRRRRRRLTKEVDDAIADIPWCAGGSLAQW